MPCFKTVDPSAFLNACDAKKAARNETEYGTDRVTRFCTQITFLGEFVKNLVTSCEGGGDDVGGICTQAAAYVEICRLKVI